MYEVTGDKYMYLTYCVHLVAIKRRTWGKFIVVYTLIFNFWIATSKIQSFARNDSNHYLTSNVSEHLHASTFYLKNKRQTWWNLLFYFTSYVLNMFRTLIYPSSGACDYSVELPHWSYCCWFHVCWSFGVVWLEWYPCCRLKLQPATRIPLQTNHT